MPLTRSPESETDTFKQVQICRLYQALFPLDLVGMDRECTDVLPAIQLLPTQIGRLSFLALTAIGSPTLRDCRKSLLAEDVPRVNYCDHGLMKWLGVTSQIL